MIYNSFPKTGYRRKENKWEQEGALALNIPL